MELDNRRNIVHKMQENPSWSHAKIAKSLGMAQTTVSSVIKRFHKSLTVEREEGSGKIRGPVDKELTRKIKRSAKQNPGLSYRDRAKKLGTSKSTVWRRLSEAGLHSYHVIKAPKRSDKQNVSVKSRSRLLYDNILTKNTGCLIMDDETYVKEDFKQLNGANFYVASERLGVPDRYKHQQLEKFGKKFLVWQAICSCGKKSRPFVTKTTLKSEIYLKECLKKRLLPFIRQHDSPVRFWPDLASCHYSRVTMDWLQTNNVNVVPRHMNPPYCPEFRPIEQYWAIMKAKLKKTGAEARDAKDMLRRWDKCATEVAPDIVRSMMSRVNGTVRAYIRS